MLCDEPTGALDVATGKIVLAALMNVNKQYGTTLIVITHNAAIGEAADRVIHMKDGRVRTIITNEYRIALDEIEW